MKTNLVTVRLMIVVVAGLAIIASIPQAECSPPSVDLQKNQVQQFFPYRLPPDIEKQGLLFADKTIPIGRPDVHYRILKEVNYLLLDRRSKVVNWLAKADSLRSLISVILKKYDLPPEFIYLAAIESSYNGRALSSAGAFGYWQFIKSTAQNGPAGCDQYDWKMQISSWKDERADLVKSTHAAARYLAWMNRVKKVGLNEREGRDGFNDWLLTAAAYNAGPSRILQRLNSYGVDSYWDAPLPAETEQYVPRLIALSIISRYRNFYGVQVPQTKSVEFETVDKVKLVKDLPFAVMARLLSISPREVWELNSRIPSEKAVFPAYSGKAGVLHSIHVPKGYSKKLLAQLAANGYVKKQK
jgi:soluble lytic murein transglycosylase-like protein